MKSTTHPDKVQTAIDVLGQYEISTSDVAPFWYRQYLRFKPDTPPPLWGASKGYWVSLAFVYAFAIGGIVEAAAGYLAWQDQGSSILAMGFNPFTQTIIWTLAGLFGWVLAYNSRCSCRTERTSIGLPAWGEFHSTWRISSEFLQQRTAPERYWLASMLGKPMFTRAWLAGIALFGLLAWQLPMKVGDISAAESLGYFVFCLIALARTEQGKIMPANPAAWQCGSGFWLGFTTAAVVWTGVANMLGLPKNNETLVYGIGSFIPYLIEIVRYKRQTSFMKRVEIAEQKKQLVEAQLQ
ncbi:MAG: hypothetical protein WCL29_02455, partial [Pseudomonadota bacterium]